MTQHLSEADVRGIAEYTRIGLDAEEVVAMTADLNAIIDSLAPITEFDLDGVEPTFHPIGDLSNVMRDDEVRGSFTQEVALENAAAYSAFRSHRWRHHCAFGLHSRQARCQNLACRGHPRHAGNQSQRQSSYQPAYPAHFRV